MHPDTSSQSGPDGGQSVQPWTDRRASGPHDLAPVYPVLQEKGTPWARYLAALRRYKWIVVLVTVLGAAVGAAASTLMNPIYLAQATVWVEDDPGDRGPIQPDQLMGQEGWIDLLKSFAVLDSAVLQVKLFLGLESSEYSGLFSEFELRNPFAPGDYRLLVDADGTRLSLATALGLPVEQAAVGDSLGRQVGFAWVPPPGMLSPGAEIGFSVVRPRDAARKLADNLRITTSRNSNLLRVELEGADAALTTATVNAVVDGLVEVAAFLKRAKLTELVTILAEQLAQAEGNLQRAEIALERFRVNTITLPSDAPVAAGLQITQGPVLTRFFELGLERDRVARERDAILAALDSAGDSRFSASALEIIEAVQNSSEVTALLAELTQRQADLRALRYQYTDDHPGVQDAQQAVHDLESATLPSLLRGLAGGLALREAQLDAQIETGSEELRQIPRRVIQEARLRREVDVAVNLHNTLQERHEGAKLAEVSSIPDVRILDAAVEPVTPFRNTDSRYVLMGLMLGLGMGVFGTVLRDRMDQRVRYPDQVAVDLGLQILGVIPHFKRGGNGSTGGQSDPVIEAMRGVRMNLLHSHGTAGPLIVTVTSAGPGDGKSFVAANLAVSFAEAGFRTLLVDADTRRGTLHRVLKLERKPGLTDYLNGQASATEIVRDTELDSLQFVASGTRTRNAPELLGSTAMTDFITNLRTGSQTTAVIIDTPPLAAGVDAFTMSTMTGNLLLVVRIGSTDRELAGVKLDILDRLPVRVLGAVLNDAPADSAHGYYSYYLQGYEHESEEGSPPRRLPVPSS